MGPSPSIWVPWKHVESQGETEPQGCFPASTRYPLTQQEGARGLGEVSRGLLPLGLWLMPPTRQVVSEAHLKRSIPLQD